MTPSGDGALPDRFLDDAMALARHAGEVILPHFRAGGAVEFKDDDSPVTEADRAAERVIVAGLERLTPALPVVAEESMAAGARPDIGGGRFWLVDPLDGTKEFIAGRDEFTVNIALVEAARPVLGVIHLPVRGVLYAAAGPGTATVRSDASGARPIAARTPPEDGFVVTTSRSHANRPDVDRYLRDLAVGGRVITGSSVKFCLIAAAEADLYPRLGPTMEWDTAAGHAILAAAGGSVRTLDGEDLAYGKPGVLNPPFVARGRGA